MGYYRWIDGSQCHHLLHVLRQLASRFLRISAARRYSLGNLYRQRPRILLRDRTHATSSPSNPGPSTLLGSRSHHCGSCQLRLLCKGWIGCIQASH